MTTATKSVPKKTVTKKKAPVEAVSITPPNFQTVLFLIRGTTPYVQNKFSAKAKQMMHDTQEAGPVAKKGKKREAKDFQACYEGAMHVAEEGWHGIPAPAFRNALISACKIVGFHMTKAKLSLFIVADGFDPEDGCPLVKITKGKPEYTEMFVRNATGVADLRARPKWNTGWEAELAVQFDADQFTSEDVANLLMRVGVQVGVGEGRPDSPHKYGMGWGLFQIVGR